MNLIQIAIKRPMTVAMVFCAVALFGVISYFCLPVELMPNDSFRHITVYVPVRGGMPPDRVEMLVTRPIEEALSSVVELKEIESISKSGSATVVLSFAPNTKMDFALLDVREKFALVKNKLPRESDKPIIAKYRQSDIPVFIVSLISKELSPEKLRTWVDEQAKEKLLQLSGVANVEVSGGRERKILVEVDLESLNAARISIQEIVNAIHASNLNMVVGNWKEGDQKLVVRSLSAFEKIDELKQMVIANPSENVLVRLQDVAKVEDDYLEQQSLSRLNSENVVTLYIQKESSANTLKVCRALNQKIAELVGNEKGLEYDVVSDQSVYIAKAMNRLTSSLGMGALLVSGVLLLFFRSWRPILVLALSLPLSLCCAFVAMFTLGISINVMSLSGLALGIGLLVDNAILVLENILKKSQKNPDFFKAVESGTSQVVMALIASTLTTLIVFLPFLYLDPELRLFYRSLALTVTFSLLASLFISVTFVPSYIFKLKIKMAGSKPVMTWLLHQYQKVLKIVLSYKEAILILLVGLFIITIWLFQGMEKELGGEEDRGKFTILVELPAGAKLEVSDKVVYEIENFLKSFPEIETVTSRVEGWSSKVFVSLVPEKKRALSTRQFMDKIRPQLALFGQAEKAFCYFSEVQAGRRDEIRLELYGYDYDQLKSMAQQMGALLNEIPGVGEIKMRYKPGRPELTLAIDRDKVALAGFTPQQVAEILHAQLRGLEATKFHLENREVDTIVRLEEKDRKQLSDLKNIRLTNTKGEMVLLTELVDFKETITPSEIWHKGKRRMIEVSGVSYESSLNQVAALLQNKLANLHLPKGYSIQIGEEYFIQKKRFSQLLLAIFLAVLLIYMLLASLFESYLQPLVVLSSIPLAFIGAIGLIWFCHKPVTLGVLVGAILLVGIVVNHAIVLIQSFNHLVRSGMGRVEAIIESGKERLEPILMMTATTILGLLPLVFFSTASETLWSPLALTLIGGIAFSTLLTLLVVPILLKVSRREKKGIKE